LAIDERVSEIIVRKGGLAVSTTSWRAIPNVGIFQFSLGV